MTLRFKTSDGQIVEAENHVLRKSSMIRDVIANNEGKIPTEMLLDKIDSETLKLIIEYYDHYKDVSEEEEAAELGQLPYVMKEYDQQFFDSQSHAVIFNILTHSTELDLKRIMNAGAKYAADMAKGKTVDEIRKIYEISSDSEDGDDEE